jgi:ABC-type amino acid transport substrate-binding protein
MSLKLCPAVFASFILSLCALISGPTAAKAEVAPMPSTTIVPVISTMSFCYFKWTPYGNKVDNLTQDDVDHQGIAIDIIRTIGVHLKQRIIFDQIPYKRCMAAVASGHYDGTAYYVPNNHEGVRPVDYSFMGHLAAFFVRKESPHQRYTGLQQFSNQTIAVLRGGSSVMWLEGNRKINLYRANRQDYLWQMIKGRRVDASIDDYLTYISSGKDKAQEVRALLPIARYVPINAGLAERHSARLGNWKLALENMQASGELDAIYQKHVGTTHSKLLEQLAP